MSATRRQVHTPRLLATIRGTTIIYPARDLPNAWTKSRRKCFASQLVKKTRHINEPQMTGQLVDAS